MMRGKHPRTTSIEDSHHQASTSTMVMQTKPSSSDFHNHQVPPDGPSSKKQRTSSTSPHPLLDDGGALSTHTRMPVTQAGLSVCGDNNYNAEGKCPFVICLFTFLCTCMWILFRMQF
jgi:hypothetical protein